MRPKINFANVTALLALVVALAGTSYAATQLPRNSVDTKQIQNSAVTPKKLSEKARKLGKLKCPADTVSYLGMCFESAERPAATFVNAQGICDAAGRRLPDLAELLHFSDRVPNIGWSDVELTSTAFTDDANGDRVYAVTDVATVSNVAWGTAKAFRCVVPPSN